MLEGGGQILRNSLGYAAILGYPVRISKIRAGRKAPGLAAQHLESFKLLRDLTNATLQGDKVGSTEVTFTPKKLKEAPTCVSSAVCEAFRHLLLGFS